MASLLCVLSASLLTLGAAVSQAEAAPAAETGIRVVAKDDSRSLAPKVREAVDAKKQLEGLDVVIEITGLVATLRGKVPSEAVRLVLDKAVHEAGIEECDYEKLTIGKAKEEPKKATKPPVEVPVCGPVEEYCSPECVPCCRKNRCGLRQRVILRRQCRQGGRRCC